MGRFGVTLPSYFGIKKEILRKRIPFLLYWLYRLFHTFVGIDEVCLFVLGKGGGIVTHLLSEAYVDTDACLPLFWGQTDQKG